MSLDTSELEEALSKIQYFEGAMKQMEGDPLFCVVLESDISKSIRGAPMLFFKKCKTDYAIVTINAPEPGLNVKRYMGIHPYRSHIVYVPFKYNSPDEENPKQAL